MLFVARFEDNPDKLDVRREQTEAHLRNLDKNKERILVAGSLRMAPDQAPVGGMWVIEAPDLQEAKRLCHADPFWTRGLRKSVMVLHWSKAFPDRKTPV